MCCTRSTSLFSKICEFSLLPSFTFFVSAILQTDNCATWKCLQLPILLVIIKWKRQPRSSKGTVLYSLQLEKDFLHQVSVTWHQSAVWLHSWNLAVAEFCKACFIIQSNPVTVNYQVGNEKLKKDMLSGAFVQKIHVIPHIYCAHSCISPWFWWKGVFH